MPLLNDIRSARNVFRNILRSRRNRRLVAQRQADHERPEPGTIQIAVYFADTKVNLYQLRQG